VHPKALAADLDCPPALDVADYPSRFEHNPPVGMGRVGQTAFRYLHAADEYENVTVFILANLESRSSLVTHGSALEFAWLALTFRVGGPDLRRAAQHGTKHPYGYWQHRIVFACPAQIRHGPRPEELLLKLLGLKVSARGRVAVLMAGPVAMLLLAVAWRILAR
jgi:hypothetical protein